MEKIMQMSVVLVLMLALTACAKKGPLEQLGEEIDEGVENTLNGGETLGNQIDDTLDDIQNNIEDAVE
jgi:hypothetical protein